MKTFGAFVFLGIALATSHDSAVWGAVGATLLIIVSGGFARRTQF